MVVAKVIEYAAKRTERKCRECRKWAKQAPPAEVRRFARRFRLVNRIIVAFVVLVWMGLIFLLFVEL